MSGAFAYEYGHDQLQELLDWLVTQRFLQPSAVPPCWPQHGLVVDALDALLLAREQAVVSQNGPARLAWLRDWLQVLLPILHGVQQSCTPSHCTFDDDATAGAPNSQPLPDRQVAGGGAAAVHGPPATT